MMPENVEIVPVEVERLSSVALSLPVQARALKIVDQPTYDVAASFERDCKAFIKKVEEYHKPLKEAAHGAWKKIVAAEAGMIAGPTEALGIVKGARLTFELEQERIRREAQAKLEAEAKRKAEEDAVIAAAQAEAAGAAPEFVQAVLEAPPVVAPVVAPPTFAKAKGVSRRDNWTARVTSLIELVKFVAEHPENLNLLEANQTALNQMARAQKSLLKVPGVQALCDKV